MYLKAAAFGYRKGKLRQTEVSIDLVGYLPLQFTTILRSDQTLQDLRNIVKGFI